MTGHRTALLLAAALLVGACTAEDDVAAPDEPAAEAPAAPAPLPPAPAPKPGPSLTTPPPPSVVDDDTIARLTSRDVSDAVPRWYMRLGVERTTALASIAAARRDPPHDAQLGTLRITDRIERLSGACPVEIRSIEGIDLGADGSPRIHATLEVIARRSLLDVAWVRELAAVPCGVEGRAFAYQEVAEVACAIPDARPYRCIVITTHATDTFPIVDHAVVDVRSGKVVDLAEIVAQLGGGGDSARRKVAALLCERIGTTDEYGPLDEGDVCPPLPARLGLVPGPDGLTVVMQGLYLPWVRDELWVSWEELAYAGYVPTFAPPRAADVNVPEPRPTPDAVLVREAPDPWMQRLGVDRLIPMDRIPATFADPALPADLGPLRVTGAVQRARRYCAAELRHVVGVDVGSGAAVSADRRGPRRGRAALPRGRAVDHRLRRGLVPPLRRPATLVLPGAQRGALRAPRRTSRALLHAHPVDLPRGRRRCTVRARPARVRHAHRRAAERRAGAGGGCGHPGRLGRRRGPGARAGPAGAVP
jgi:hypothetical protein